jgi:hypothetical protein
VKNTSLRLSNTTKRIINAIKVCLKINLAINTEISKISDFGVFLQLKFWFIFPQNESFHLGENQPYWCYFYVPFFFRCLKKIITLPNTILSFENKSTILFSDFSQHEINLNKSSQNTENALIEWLRKDTTSYFTKTIVYVVVLSLFFKTVFEIFLASLVCLQSVK